jgi:hypothetical protein
MITHLRFQGVTLGIKHYEVGVLFRHVTIDAVGAGRMIAAGESGHSRLVTT